MDYSNYIGPLIFSCFLLSFLYWKTKLHKNPQFIVFINVVIALTIIFTTFSIILQINLFDQTQRNEQNNVCINLFYNLSSEVARFQSHTNLNYYYIDLMGAKPLTKLPMNREKVLEQQITSSILARSSDIIYYINEIKRDAYLKELYEITKNRFNKLMSRFCKSKIFLEHWITYKNTISSQITIDYMKTNFNV